MPPAEPAEDQSAQNRDGSNALVAPMSTAAIWGPLPKLPSVNVRELPAVEVPPLPGPGDPPVAPPVPAPAPGAGPGDGGNGGDGGPAVLPDGVDGNQYAYAVSSWTTNTSGSEIRLSAMASTKVTDPPASTEAAAA